MRCRQRSADAQHLDLEPKEVHTLTRVSIEPVKRSAVLVADFLGDPDNDRRLQPCSVCDELAKMIVVGLLQLVLDDNGSTASEVTGSDVRGKVAYWGLS